MVPAKEEAETLPILVASIFDVATQNAIDIAEIILIDDGSRDDTWAVMERLAQDHSRVVAIRLRRNFGKSAALMAGVRRASGQIIVTMDADLQDDPVELPRFVTKIGEGYDIVSGWKKERHDPLSKTLPSAFFNRVTSVVSGLTLHDFNCGYKAYNQELFDSIRLYGDLHRFIPVLAHSLGFSVTEIAVQHHPRQFGHSKYGVRRLLSGCLDLLTVVTITRFANRPGHLFGGIGLAFVAGGLGVLAYLILIKLFTGASIGDRPLLSLGIMANVIGVQLLLFGMLAELVISRSPDGPSVGNMVKKVVGPR